MRALCGSVGPPCRSQMAGRVPVRDLQESGTKGVPQKNESRQAPSPSGSPRRPRLRAPQSGDNEDAVMLFAFTVL
ncbi:hypothetical protein SKAU_G00270320 [Synaphobranchus kaupii]|uniref:Uncharacterized protein n=1 Tax=Synaphobranchus kaupii TaxID=118154 RepID=A0A9Q1F077_SYNKA|nr:hypothetical protein SKAU_G00270320 [Synaphobranchus kaupii]